MKKGRHRRFEEARALKRNQEMDIDSILESLMAFKRAGANAIISYYADRLDKIIK